MNHDGNWERYVGRDTKIIAWPNMHSGMIDVMMATRNGPDYAWYSVGKPLEFVRCDERSAEPRTPTMTLDPQAAQLLMDQLWSVGLRPTEGTGSAGSLAATQHHLADMRRIAFAGLNIEVKP